MGENDLIFPDININSVDHWYRSNYDFWTVHQLVQKLRENFQSGHSGDIIWKWHVPCINILFIYFCNFSTPLFLSSTIYLKCIQWRKFSLLEEKNSGRIYDFSGGLEVKENPMVTVNCKQSWLRLYCQDWYIKQYFHLDSKEWSFPNLPAGACSTQFACLHGKAVEWTVLTLLFLIFFRCMSDLQNSCKIIQKIPLCTSLRFHKGYKEYFIIYVILLSLSIYNFFLNYLRISCSHHTSLSSNVSVCIF